jgi:hypothetical protein
VEAEPGRPRAHRFRRVEHVADDGVPHRRHVHTQLVCPPCVHQRSAWLASTGPLKV